ncbi:ChbG/HpnK family deacetylase [Paenibacillus lautus]
MRRIITRADDYASSRSANAAIARTVEAGFIKNVSIMAPGPYLAEAAQLLAHRKDICFGFHMT